MYRPVRWHGRRAVSALTSNVEFGGYRDGEDPWLTHWRWTAITKGTLIEDLWKAHRRELKGGVATGKCLCGLPAPCPTAELIAAHTAAATGPCQYARHTDQRCPTNGQPPAAS